jgi:hypothetical protein
MQKSAGIGGRWAQQSAAARVAIATVCDVHRTPVAPRRHAGAHSNEGKMPNTLTQAKL